MQKKSGYEENVEKHEFGDSTAHAEPQATGPEATVGADPWQPALRKLPVSLAYAAVIDVRNAEFEITDQMVHQACQDIEVMQQFPFAPKSSALSK